jgi:phosphoglycolate phosphatase
VIILFDMDGVLVDSRVAIARSMAHAFRSHGFEPPPDEVLQAQIGPPLDDALGHLLAAMGADVQLTPLLVSSYRERYREHCIAETPAYPGIAELLERLAPRHRLGVVTSKPIAFALPILRALALDVHMAVIEGPSLDARGEPKQVTLGRALTALGGPPVASVTLVGDRSHDVAAARAHGIRSVGVLWGIGSHAELTAAGADVLVATPDELLERLLRTAT